MTLPDEIEHKKDHPSRLMDEQQKYFLPVAFAMIYMRLAEVAKECGYALALHGSMRRDLDVVAIPWTEDAVEAEELVRRLLAGSSACLRPNSAIVSKPHGRRCWMLHLGGGPYIDLSVMPRVTQEQLGVSDV